jgi:hypothetical protein
MPALIAVGTSAGAQDICKWVDRAGGVHYGEAGQTDQPCVARIRVIHPDPEELARAQQRYMRLRAQMTRPLNATPAAEGPGYTQAQRLAEIKGRCQDAQAELRFLEGAWGMRLIRPTAQQSEESIDWIDDQERRTLTDAWRKQVSDWCGPSPPISAGPEPDRAYGAPTPRPR